MFTYDLSPELLTRVRFAGPYWKPTGVYRLWELHCNGMPPDIAPHVRTAFPAPHESLADRGRPVSPKSESESLHCRYYYSISPNTAMQLRNPTCPVLLAGDTTTTCNMQITPPLLFCERHGLEYHTLKEQETTTTREEDALKKTMDKTVVDDVDTYSAVEEVQTAKVMVELYARTLERHVELKEALRIRFAQRECPDLRYGIDTVP